MIDEAVIIHLKEFEFSRELRKLENSRDYNFRFVCTHISRSFYALLYSVSTARRDACRYQFEITYSSQQLRCYIEIINKRIIKQGDTILKITIRSYNLFANRIIESQTIDYNG